MYSVLASLVDTRLLRQSTSLVFKEAVSALLQLQAGVCPAPTEMLVPDSVANIQTIFFLNKMSLFKFRIERVERIVIARELWKELPMR